MYGHLELVPRVADGRRSPCSDLAAWPMYELDLWPLMGKLVDALLKFLPLSEERPSQPECTGVISSVEDTLVF